MAHVQGERLIQMQRRLADFGGRSDGGVSREALSTTELAARQWLCGLCTGALYQWYIDDAANLIVRRHGTDPDLAPVMTGSHIDTQPIGGWLDGAYGVIAGLEVLHALDDAGIQTRRAIEVAIWTNEEGSRFSPGAMGSSAFSDPTRLQSFLAVQDAQGQRFESARNAALQATPTAQRIKLGHPVHAYIEAHIEQGPVMECGGYSLGIVTVIQGVRWYEVTVHGNSAHAGTTPLATREDALLTAATMVSHLGAAAAARHDDALRWTVGRFEVAPGSINTIADRVTFSVDVRHPQESELSAMHALLHRVLEQNQGACTYEVRALMQRAPTAFDAQVLAILESAVLATQAPHCHLGSGAFHDAMYLADCCPTAMLFVPSKKGISHNAAEDTLISDLVEGARALAAALVALADA
ncbi:M20 family metallo-hydrolase [Polaromonas jejuensis]|uniref:M20 family metallo-hydrolase n=1 Tax=Polaromonas jejuensis TaxID=457502 RepID=A0ABW0QE67_9BURK|nr:M20 family metallo-hydrolase [Polaromonas jejuensis]